jgi:hypothetical protein
MYIVLFRVLAFHYKWITLCSTYIIRLFYSLFQYVCVCVCLCVCIYTHMCMCMHVRAGAHVSNTVHMEGVPIGSGWVN